MKKQIIKNKIFIMAIISGVILASTLNLKKSGISRASASETETIVCPGSGERCARVYVWGVGLWWKKKTKGGPGLIIKEIE